LVLGKNIKKKEYKINYKDIFFFCGTLKGAKKNEKKYFIANLDIIIHILELGRVLVFNRPKYWKKSYEENRFSPYLKKYFYFLYS
jgi:hypothetical protein